MLNLSVKNDWMIARQLLWGELAPYSKRKLKPKDIMEFDWEKPKKLQLPKQEVTQETVQRAMQLAQKRKEQLLKAGALT
jgi:valyl-tRNA synthetase